MEHQTITIAQLLFVAAAIIAILLSIVLFVIRATEEQHLKTIWNYPAIRTRFKQLKHDIQFAATKTELKILEDAVDQFYYDFDTVKSHSVVTQFFTSLREQAIFKKQNLIDDRRSRDISKTSLAVIIWIVVMGLASCSGQRYGCKATEGIVGFYQFKPR